MSNPAPQREEHVNPWAEYERRKAQLPNDLTPEQRESECRRIANELGI